MTTKIVTNFRRFKRTPSIKGRQVYVEAGVVMGFADRGGQRHDPKTGKYLPKGGGGAAGVVVPFKPEKGVMPPHLAAYWAKKKAEGGGGAKPPAPVAKPVPKPDIKKQPFKPEDHKDAKSMKDFMEKKHYPTKFYVHDGDLESAAEILQQYDMLAGLYPGPASKVASVGITKFGSAKAYAHVIGFNKFTIEFNTTYFGKEPGARKKLLNAVRGDAATGWHPKGTGVPKSITTHEFGHVVQGWMNTSLVSTKGGGSGPKSINAKLKNMWNLDKVSKYAKTNDREGFAEGFASMYHTPRHQQNIYTVRAKDFLREAGLYAPND